MPERSSYPDGAPCWADVMSHDAVAAGVFYRGVFGWDLADMGEDFGHYTIASVGGKTVAAITPPPPGADYMPSVWNVYLKAGDAGSAGAAIVKAGGTVTMPAMEVPGQGTMLMATDPTGAMFGVWQPGGHTGAQLFAENGAIGWAEVHTPDAKAADAFYTDAFPLTGEVMSDGVDYTVFKSGDDMVAGRVTIEGESPYWLVYFVVADPDATVGKVRQLGGEVTMEPEDTPYGRMSVVADPAGAMFAVIKPPQA
jgi:uncharacterized protein